MQPNYYSIIPASVRYNPSLSPYERLMFGEITALVNMRGVCNARNKYFADLYQVDKCSVSRWLKNLSDEGVISIKINDEGEREIYPLMDVSGIKIETTGERPEVQSMFIPFNLDLLQKHSTWHESFCKNNGIELSRLDECIKEFIKYVTDTEDYKKYQGLNEAKGHFTRWYLKRYKNESNKSNSENTESKRNGKTGLDSW